MNCVCVGGLSASPKPTTTIIAANTTNAATNGHRLMNRGGGLAKFADDQFVPDGQPFAPPARSRNAHPVRVRVRFSRSDGGVEFGRLGDSFEGVLAAGLEVDARSGDEVAHCA